MDYKATFKATDIVADTGRAILVKAPNSKRKIWLPNSLVSLTNKGKMAFKIYDDFEFITGNKEPISPKEVIALFGNHVYAVDYNKPEKLEAKHIEADDTLKRWSEKSSS